MVTHATTDAAAAPRVEREFPTRWRAVSAYASLATVLAIVTVLPITSFLSWRPLDVGELGPFSLFVGQGVLAAFLAVWFALQTRTGLRGFLHLPRRPWPPRVAEGVIVGVRGWLITMLVMVVLGVAAQTLRVTPQEGFTDIMVWMARRPLALRVAVVVSAMVVEEAFFRAFLQPRVGLLLATLCFAAGHVNYGSPTMGGGVFVIGWVLGRAFQRSDDVAVCAVAHGTFDAIQLLIVLPLIASRL